MIKLNGIFIIFIIISLFFNPESAFCKKKNQNIAKAESLIKQRKFKEARDILAREYSTDPENEDLIIKLINKIEDEEGKVGETTEAVTRSLLNNDTKRAAELLKDLNKLKGEYSEKVKEIIKTTEIVNEQVTKLNDFYGYLEEAEKNLVKREIIGVAENYNKAITIFKVTEKNSGRFNTYFLDYCNDFNLLEDKVLNSGIELKFLKEKERFSFENIVDEYIKMVTRINEWIKIEDELIFLKKRMEKTDLISKKTIEFQSYELINFSYVDLIRNRITVYSLTLMENIFKLLERYIVEMEKGNFQNQSIVENLFDLINNKKVEKYANYNLNFNFTRDLYLKRSYLNINEFLEYITGKNNLFARSKIAKLKSIYENANKYYDTFKTNVTDRELQSAEKNIKLSAGFIDSLFQGREEIAGIIFDYNEILDTKYYKETYDKYRMLNENIVSLNLNIKTGTKELEDTMYSIKILLNEANENFNVGLNNYKRERFEEAKDNFTRANDRYFEILSKVKEKDVERKIEATKKYIEDIEQRFYKKDMEIADKQLDNARKNFYNENYEEAKKNLDYAESLFVKYNEENETLSYYRERIASAIRIKSGTKVKTDDPAYD
nr:hypothetical protein [Spirochaetota bacterium]